MKLIKVFIVLGVILTAFQAFGQGAGALTVMEGQAGRGLLEHAIFNRVEARFFFAKVLGIEPEQITRLDPAICQSLIINRLNLQCPDQQQLIEKARKFITPLPTGAADLDLTLKTPTQPIQVTIELGDITLKKADAYIVPQFNNAVAFDGVRWAIAQAGGKPGLDVFENRFRALGPQAFGSAHLTPSGGGNTPNLIHVIAISPGKNEEFRVVSSSIYHALCVAEEQGLTTVAAPILGRGDMGTLSAEMSAIAMMEGIERFSKREERPRFVKEITIVVYDDPETYNALLKIKQERQTSSPRDDGKLIPIANFKPITTFEALVGLLHLSNDGIVPTADLPFLEGLAKATFEASGEWERVGKGPGYVDYTPYIGRTVGGFIVKADKALFYIGTLINVENGSPADERPFLIGGVRDPQGNMIQVPLELYDKIFFVRKNNTSPESPVSPGFFQHTEM